MMVPKSLFVFNGGLIHFKPQLPSVILLYEVTLTLFGTLLEQIWCWRWPKDLGVDQKKSTFLLFFTPTSEKSEVKSQEIVVQKGQKVEEKIVKMKSFLTIF